MEIYLVHDEEASSSDSFLIPISRNNRIISAKNKQANFKIPNEHSFVIGDIKNQSLAVLCEGLFCTCIYDNDFSLVHFSHNSFFS